MIRSFEAVREALKNRHLTQMNPRGNNKDWAGSQIPFALLVRSISFRKQSPFRQIRNSLQYDLVFKIKRINAAIIMLLFSIENEEVDVFHRKRGS